MSTEITLDPNLFIRHIEALVQRWEKHYSDVDCLVVVNGRDSEHNVKTRAFQSWLFCYELTDTLIALSKESVIIYCASLKAKILGKMQTSLTTSSVKLKIIKRDKKDKDSTTAAMNNLLQELRSSGSGKTIGVLKNETQTGDFSEIWETCLNASEFDKFDIAPFLSDLMCVKDAQEQKCVRTAATITVTILKKFMLRKIEDIIDNEATVSHSEIADEAEDLFVNPQKISEKLLPEVVDSCYPPIVQSGGVYNLALNAECSKKNLSFDTIICSVGTKYKRYCSDISRTFFIDPSKEQEECYSVALLAHAAVVETLRPGNTLGQVYQKAVDVIKASSRPDIEPKLLQNLGAAIGIELNDPYFQIEAGNTKKVKEGMSFDVRIGFEKLKDIHKSYAILISDTVLVAEKTTEVLTDKCTKDLVEISYEIGSDEEVEEKNTKDTKKEKGLKKNEISNVKFSMRKNETLNSIEVGTGSTKRTMRNTTSRDLKVNSSSAEAQRQAHQHQLLEEMIENAKKALLKKRNKGGSEKEEEEDEAKEFYAYNSHKEFPLDVQRDTIYVDTKRECVILPIYGQMVPFHIMTIRSATKTDDHLRILFKHPGGGTTPNDKLSDFADETATFIKGLTYRVTNTNNLNNSYRLIMELKKRTTQRDTELKQKQSLKVQPTLQLAPPQKVFRLPNLKVRPVMGNAKLSGTLETHANGFRFTTKKGNIDIIYSNIKHAFFQPSEAFSPIIALHFHLHSDIMVGKKKSQDIQFYSEIVEMSMTVSGPAKRTSRWGDNEEIEEEQRERQMKAKLNQDFKTFMKRAMEVNEGRVQFDVPYKELSFTGVPTRNNIILQPTINCLIHVIETPFFVMSLDEVQIAYFERVQFSLKNFDLVFVLKDWSAKEVHINAIPTESLESIKSWLDSCNIKYYQGKENLNWKKLLDRISLNPLKFWDNGGWEILNEKQESSTEEDSEDHDDSDAEAANYRPSESSDEESDFSESDSGSDESSFSDETDGSEGGSGDASESEDAGLDWEELEMKATRDDAKRKARSGDDSDDEERNSNAKKRRTQAPPSRPAVASAGRGKPLTSSQARPLSQQPLRLQPQGNSQPLRLMPKPGQPGQPRPGQQQIQRPGLQQRKF